MKILLLVLAASLLSFTRVPGVESTPTRAVTGSRALSGQAISVRTDESIGLRISHESFLKASVARGPAEVRRCSSAAKQFEHAKLQKRRIRTARGESRTRARRDAVRAYRAVREYFPRDTEWVCEASFRAGELLRSGGETDSAISEFQHAERTGARSVYRGRAGLELGHIHRRVGRTNEALKCYERAEALGPDFAEQRDLAAYWQGKVHSTLGRQLDARRCFQRAAESGVEPLQRIRAFDAWADVLITVDELEGAAGVLERCRVSMKDRAAELSNLGKRVRGALDHMRSPARLAVAVAERRRKRRG